MGMYNTIEAKLECPVNGAIQDIEIQVRWGGGVLEHFKIGDDINFAKNMKSLWIKDSYVCDSCQDLMDERYSGWRETYDDGVHSYPAEENCPNGKPDIDEYSHSVYVNIQKGILMDIISEAEFKKRELSEFLEGDEISGFY